MSHAISRGTPPAPTDIRRRRGVGNSRPRRARGRLCPAAAGVDSRPAIYRRTMCSSSTPGQGAILGADLGTTSSRADDLKQISAMPSRIRRSAEMISGTSLGTPPHPRIDLGYAPILRAMILSARLSTPPFCRPISDNGPNDLRRGRGRGVDLGIS